MAALVTSMAHSRPRPASRWYVAMRWRNLLFAHWPVGIAELRPLIPERLEIDTFEGQAWIGIVPFHLTIRYRWMPLALSFPEVNVRTYIRRGQQMGVWFLSLDAHSRLAVTVARRQYALPYRLARMSMRSAETASGPRISFTCERRSESPVRALLDMAYRPIGEAFCPQPGTLEHWLTERYSLFAARPDGRVAFGEIDHRPWQLQPAEADFAANTMLAPLDIATPADQPLLHFSRSIDALAWKLRWSGLDRKLQPQPDLRDVEVDDDPRHVDKSCHERAGRVAGVDADPAKDHREHGADERAPQADGGDRLADDEG
jgi:uncharacterized protein